MASALATLGVVGVLLASAGVGCSSGRHAAAVSTEENKAIVRRLLKALNDGDLAARNAIVDPGRVFHSATIDKRGSGVPETTLREACPMCASLNPREITIDFMVAEGDLVTVHSTWRGTYTDVIHGVPIAGKDVVVSYTNTYRIENGRVVENWAAYDRLHLLEQLGFGVVPPAPASVPASASPAQQND